MTHEELVRVAGLCDQLASSRDKVSELEQEIDRLKEVERLAERFARAKGRHHSQHAACDLMEHFGVQCVRPG